MKSGAFLTSVKPISHDALPISANRCLRLMQTIQIDATDVPFHYFIGHGEEMYHMR